MIATLPYLEVTMAGLAAGAVFGLLALGLVLIYRTTGVLNFGHWAIGLMGITVYALLTGAGLPVGVALVLAIATSILTGVLAYRTGPARRRPEPGGGHAGRHRRRPVLIDRVGHRSGARGARPADATPPPRREPGTHQHVRPHAARHDLGAGLRRGARGRPGEH